MQTKTYYNPEARLALYCPEEFLGGKSKTAEGVIRYGPNPIACVIDAKLTGKRVSDLMAVGCQAPVVASIAEALTYSPDALLLGTAWSGGALPEAWRSDIKSAIAAGLDIINGLHDFLNEDPEFSELARTYGVKLIDVRQTPSKLPVGNALARDLKSFVVLTVGSDCSVGKMTTALEICRSAERAGEKAGFVATGQTGIMIAGSGITIDRCIGDFMAGAVETLVLEAASEHDLVLVEGQGSLTHPGFSGVTLSLLHGACPKALILCHKSQKQLMGGTNLPIISLSALKDLYEHMASYIRPSKVIGIALNTTGFGEEEAKRLCAQASDETGLPSTDPVRFTAKILYDAIQCYRKGERP